MVGGPFICILATHRHDLLVPENGEGDNHEGRALSSSLSVLLESIGGPCSYE